MKNNILIKLKNNKFYLLIIFLTIISSCTQPKNQIKDKVEIIKSVEFKTGFVELMEREMGIFYDCELKKELVAFFNENSCVKIFDLKGDLINTVPLKNLNNFMNGSFSGLIPFARDSILFCTDYNNRLAMINRSGNIIASLKIDEILPDSLKNRVQLWLPDLANPLISPNCLLLSISPDEDNLAYLNKNIDSREEKDIYYYSNTVYESPHLLQINNFLYKGFENYKFMNDFYKDNYKKGDITRISSIFKNMNNSIFLVPRNKGTILQIDPENNNLIKTITVKSAYTNLVFKNLNIFTDYENRDIISKSVYFEVTNGSITNILFNENTQQYYVMVWYEIKEKIDINNDSWEYRPFSVIVYDKDFENPVEYNFEGDKYFSRNVLMSSEGLLIQRKPENLNIKNYGTQTFDLLKFN
jgi:hypothetical protein